ncbi:MAG TPA: triose-phosphate isomerase [Bacilli bacterium]|nr:MAG: Triosephosphate isomerase [Tenericutes bacterium ADurb.BinA124]HNZ50172.1 triose-phosphate isomerase [Bacilli bacterium]HPX84401.1 triose-phosphate isomerase [Bacilli bacterium]HQC74786.1 triose-phosphate isomerase [Bacilli bacterium]
MRKPIIAGNWKMFKVRDEALQFIYSVSDQAPSQELVDSVICAQFTVLRCLAKRQGENIRIGAQNMHYLDEGAYTGEVSASMLKAIGVSYVIIGHSERRAMFNETDKTVNLKLHKAFQQELTPILCIGESLEQREKNLTNRVLNRQLKADLAGLTGEQVANLVIAYEPIWAIGTGKTATSEVANEACKHIRKQVAKMYSPDVANKLRIQYGGSVKVNNIEELMSMPHIDGALIGGASLKAEDFLTFLKVAVKAKSE